MSTHLMEIDHSRGRILNLNGDTFYSPNCSRLVELPPASLNDSQKVFDVKSARLRDFQSPRWWTEEFGWLAFVTLRPYFTGYPLDRLAIPTSINYIKQSEFCLTPSTATSWLRLDNCLINATSHLTSVYGQGIIRPFSPWALGYLGDYRNARAARKHANDSRDWFVVWMALLSHLIAISEAKLHEVAPTNAPDWFEALADVGFEQPWLSGVLSSIICSFSNATPRVGVFINIVSPLHGQPPVEWFIYHHIPIWYPWGTREQRLAGEVPAFARFAPYYHSGARTPLFFSSPSYTPSIRSPPSPSQYLDPESHTSRTSGVSSTLHSRAPAQEKPYQSWEEFFAQRELRNAEKEKRETPAERQKRLQRARDRPVKKAKVFIWTTSEDPDIPLSQLYRQPVPKKYNEDNIGAYGIAQRRYDPFENEWDLCEEFGLDDHEEDRDDDDDDDGRIGLITEPPTANDRGASPCPINVEDEGWSPAGSGINELVRIIAEHFGFVSPLTASSKTGPVNTKDWNDCL